MTIRRGSLLQILGFLLPFLGAANAAEIRISERVFLVPDRPNSPVEFQMVVNSGCADEAGGDCRGVAHYLEHLVLVGRNPENKDAALRFFPDAISNGWTSQRATVYTHRVPARPDGAKADLEKLFNFYSARLKDFSISAEEAARERNVVLQEHDWRLGSNPFARFAQKIDRLLLPDHPLGQWPVGSRASIQAMTLEDARAFHRSWYRRNNAWFVIKGDVAPEVLKTVSEASLGGTEAGAFPQRPSEIPPNIDESRQDLREFDAEAKKTLVFYRKLFRFDESDLAADRAAIAVLNGLLASQLPGSLHEAVVERGRLATGSPSFALRRIAPKTYLIQIGAEIALDADPGKLAEAISDYVAGAATLDLSDRNIERIKRRLADSRKAADDVPQQVYQRLIGWLAAGNPYEELGRFPALANAVRKDDIAPFLRAMAGTGRIVCGVLAPLEGPKP